MKFFYINQSLLQNSCFQVEMGKRLFHLSQTYDIQFIFISSDTADATTLKNFLSICQDFDIRVLMSPAVFEIEAIMGTLTAGSFMLEGFPNMQTDAGTLMYGDTDSLDLQRVYLGLFPNHHDGIESLMLTKEMKKIVREISIRKKNSKKNRYN